VHSVRGALSLVKLESGCALAPLSRTVTCEVIDRHDTTSQPRYLESRDLTDLRARHSRIVERKDC